ncbi:MAG: Uma2 family endonuclease [Deltaproteobacteria bacterium]|nr:Uma2 family endonuclease [Deltaproteobacteria bacterium]
MRAAYRRTASARKALDRLDRVNSTAYIRHMVSSEAPRAKVVWTYDDYRQMPDDGRRYEVIEGEIYVTPAPTISHQTASKRIQTELILQLERTGKAVVYDAPVDVIMSPTRVVPPDIVVVATKRRNLVSERGIEGAPDIIVEILSPGTASVDRGAKQKLYAAAGVREYWLVDPQAHVVQVLALRGDGYQEHGNFGPGQRITSGLFDLSLAVDEVFAP